MDVNADNEAEQGSSEETLEGCSNVCTKPFSDIDSVRLIQQKLFPKDFGNQITGIVQLPNEQVVVVVGGSCLKILDKGLQTKLSLNATSKFHPQSQRWYSPKIKIALFDGRRVAALISCQTVVDSLHVISVFPSTEVSNEIKLKYVCEHFACSNNKIYCYYPDLNRSTFFICPGIEILSINGEVLKTIQLFDQVSCFCPSKDGDIIYFGSREVDGSKTDVFRRVTKDNVEVFSHASSEKPTYATSDMAGNVIVLTSSGKIVLLNPDGSQNRILLDQRDMEVTDEDVRSLGGNIGGQKRITKQLVSLCFNDDYNKLLVAGAIRSDTIIPKMWTYKLQFSQ